MHYIEKYLAEKDFDLITTLDAQKAYSAADFVVIAAPTNIFPIKTVSKGWSRAVSCTQKLLKHLSEVYTYRAEGEQFRPTHSQKRTYSALRCYATTFAHLWALSACVRIYMFAQASMAHIQFASWQN